MVSITSKTYVAIRSVDITPTNLFIMIGNNKVTPKTYDHRIIKLKERNHLGHSEGSIWTQSFRKDNAATTRQRRHPVAL